ncbi:MAG: glycosyltransferase [Pseudohongiellaceae bacterium]
MKNARFGKSDSVLKSKAAVVFAAVPSDETRGCASLLIELAEAKIPVTAVITGSETRAISSAATITPERVEKECRKALGFLGVTRLNFWRESLPGHFNERTIAAAEKAVLAAGADLVLVCSPQEADARRRATAWLVIEACRRVAVRTPVTVVMYSIDAPSPTHGSGDEDGGKPSGESLKITERRQDKIEALDCYPSLANWLPAARKTGAEGAIEKFDLVSRRRASQPVLLASADLYRQTRCTDPDLTRPKVQVLIRSMNRDNVVRALNSVALQTWPNIEVVMVNASGREHRDMSMAEGGLSLVFVESRQPLPRPQAANALLERADADFALFLDDDDWIAPEHCSRLVTQLQKSPEAAAAFSAVEYGQLSDDDWELRHVFQAEFDRNRLLFENYLPVHSVMFRPAQVNTEWNCRFDTELEIFEDWDFWIQLSQQGDFVAGDAATAYYCENQAAGSGVFKNEAAGEKFAARLQRKWASRLTPERFAELLRYSQTLYRDLGNTSSELDYSRREARQCSETLSAREKEIANFQIHTSGLEEILKAKEKDITQLRGALESLQAAAKSRLWLIKKFFRPDN